MAITIKLQPQLWQPTYNPIILVLDSDKKSETNFQYLVDLYVDGTLSSTLNVSSNPDGYGVIDLHKHIEQHITYDLETDLSGSLFQQIPNSYKSYSVVLSEEYDVSGTTTVFTGSTVMTGETYANNMVMDYLDYIDFDYTDYILSSGTTGSLITSMNNNVTVRPNDRMWVNLYNHTTDTAKYLEIVTSNGGVYRIINGYNTSNSSNKFLTVGVGPYNLMNTNSSVITVSGVQPIIQDSTESYYFRMVDVAGNPTSRNYSVTLNRNCFKWDVYNLLYLDKYGSFLNFNFELARKINKTVERKSYTRNIGSYNPTTNTWGYNTYDRGKTTLSNSINKSTQITSNWVSQSEGERVLDLFESPEVYLCQDPSQTVLSYGSPVGILTYSNTGGYLNVESTGHPFNIGDWVQLVNTIPQYNNIVAYVHSATTNNVVLTYPYSSASLNGTDSIREVTYTNSGGNIVAINIDTNSLEFKERNNIKNINYQITFSYPFNDNVQRG